MAIDAIVDWVETAEDGSGKLHLKANGKGAIAGQDTLTFTSAPFEVTALNGLPIWGGSNRIMLGEREIAERTGYTPIVFVERDDFLAAVAEWHRRENLKNRPGL